MEDPQAARIQELEAALVHKTALLREADHQLKNNLQLIASLVQLHSRRVGDETAQLALRAVIGRINAVATVHRRLSGSDDGRHLDLADLVRDLAGDLASAAGRDDIRIDLELQAAPIAAASAAPIALVLNELLGNALQHAFTTGRGGAISIVVQLTDGAWRLSVRDDGCGMSETPPGFGLTIVSLLCRQLHAEFQITAANPGVLALVHTPPRLVQDL